VPKINANISDKVQVYIDAYNGDIREAAAIAGLSYGYCKQLMMDITKSNCADTALAVQTAIRARNKEERTKTIATRQERQEFWTKIQRGEEVVIEESENAETGETSTKTHKPSLSDRLRASELLGKSELDFGERHVDVTPQTIADIAAIMGADRPKTIDSICTDNGDNVCNSLDSGDVVKEQPALLAQKDGSKAEES
jgi:hypothetical protein